ncbi:hypothetical protein F0M37_23420 [Salmonella enterica subsp. enterica]|nr:hypothetical protein [Salmonella enterica subsp. enterica serovar Johannesburg]
MTMDNATRNDSPVVRLDTRLQRLLVWSPGQRDIIKTVALLLMVLDHANRILHLDQTWLFLAGRGAFPLFALVWGLNLSRHTHLRQSAINRLWGWAVIALALAACLVVAVSALNLLTSDVAAAAGLLVTGLAVWLVSLTGKSQPRFWPADFFPIFYTCHLAVLGVLVM